MKKVWLFIAIILIPFLFSGLSVAGELTNNLRQKIAAKGGHNFIRIVIRPISNHAPVSLKSSLATEYNTRADRYRAGVERLKQYTNQSQQPLISDLNTLEQTGQIRQVKRFWITNLIELEATPDAIYDLEKLSQIEIIDAYPEISPIKPPDIDPVKLSASVGGVEDNLKAVNADSAWALGFDGSGRLVCNFDTGVKGDHPALIGNYHGNNGYPPEQCWFSPVDSSDFPTTYFDNVHGTHTMGIMIGHDDITGDTIGVAPGADWIAAVAIDIPGTSLFEAFQWAADPDGDPNTVTDLPDVINHSWGILNIGCNDILWEAIDNLEALGVVNIFAAGNERGAFHIRNPANRADDSLTNFAVGNIKHADSTIDLFASSYGPSDCDSVSIKPNVVAPGYPIRSSVPSLAEYGEYRGTSMAAPHVSGAVAILRQKNPNATVDEIKSALLNSAVDLGPPGADSVYGWGLIDIVGALELIDPVSIPSIEIEQLSYDEIFPGDNFTADLSLKNSGSSAAGVYALLSNPEEGIDILSDSIDFGLIENNALSSGDIPLHLKFNSSLESGRFYSLDLHLYADGGHLYDRRLHFFVGIKGVRTYAHHDVGRVKMTVSNYGAYGFHGINDWNAADGSYIPLRFLGYKLDRDTNDLYEASFVIGTDPEHVSDCAGNFFLEPDNDFAVAPGGSLELSQPGTFADQETESVFNDTYAENPIGLTIRQKTYGWASPPDDDFLIFEYIISNTSKIIVSGIRAGLFLDWDIAPSNKNHGTFLPTEDIGYLCYYNGTDSADFRGVKILNPEGLTNHRIYNYWTDIYDGRFTEENKYLGLADNSAGSYNYSDELAHMTATGPFNLSPGESDTAVFAIIGGRTWNQFMTSAVNAEIKYNDMILDADDQYTQGLPDKFDLRQNYPNPFNPSTTISFTLPRSGDAKIDIFNILGQNIRNLHDSKLPAGQHTVEWDGNDNSGDKAASGVYFYRINFEDKSRTRKMLLMK